MARPGSLPHPCVGVRRSIVHRRVPAPFTRKRAVVPGLAKSRTLAPLLLATSARSGDAVNEVRAPTSAHVRNEGAGRVWPCDGTQPPLRTKRTLRPLPIPPASERHRPRRRPANWRRPIDRRARPLASSFLAGAIVGAPIYLTLPLCSYTEIPLPTPSDNSYIG
jgi:hypothetical protein